MALDEGRYAIDPQRNIGTAENTQHISCSDTEAEIFAVYQLNEIPGDADLLADFWTRAEAEKYVRNRIADEARGEAIFAAMRKI